MKNLKKWVIDHKEWSTYLAIIFIILSLFFIGLTIRPREAVGESKPPVYRLYYYNLDELEPPGVAVLTFTPKWCKPCWDVWTHIYSNVESCNLGVGSSEETIEKYKVKVLPTVIIFSKGEEIKRYEGNVKFNLELDIEEIQAVVDSLVWENRNRDTAKFNDRGI